MIKKIIVTGGSGFLGHHLIRALKKNNYEVKNIDLKKNQEHPTIIADVREQSAMMAHIKDADLVFHLASFIEAGESVKKPQKYITNNITGTQNVLNAMKQNGIKNFIFSSSAAVYGEPQKIPIQETDPTIPINPYGMTKLAMEGQLSSFVSSFDFTGVALRYFNLYGPEEHHMPETHAIPRFIDQIIHNKTVTIWGKGDQKRDFLYTDDVVNAHLKALRFIEEKDNQKKYHYFNLSSEKAIKIIDIITYIEEITGKKAKVKHFDPRPGDPQVLLANASKAHQQLGWRSEVSFQQGLEKTVQYFINYYQQ